MSQHMTRMRAFWFVVLIWSIALVVAGATAHGRAGAPEPPGQAAAPRLRPLRPPLLRPPVMRVPKRACCVTSKKRPACRELRMVRRLTLVLRQRGAVARVCHGPGQAHVDDDAKGHMVSIASMRPAEASATCLTCHNRGTHAGWQGSVHESRNLSCTTCHSVHAPAGAEHQLVKATETQLCAGCHRVQVAKTERAVAHMPVREGKMACSTCHNPHGSISNVKALRTGSSIAESCVSCHTEMRGPVLWEHAPVRENCATCHDPHGSSNDRMLAVRQPMLCQRCHVATGIPRRSTTTTPSP